MTEIGKQVVFCLIAIFRKVTQAQIGCMNWHEDGLIYKYRFKTNCWFINQHQNQILARRWLRVGGYLARSISSECIMNSIEIIWNRLACACRSGICFGNVRMQIVSLSTAAVNHLTYILTHQTAMWGMMAHLVRFSDARLQMLTI